MESYQAGKMIVWLTPYCQRVIVHACLKRLINFYNFPYFLHNYITITCYILILKNSGCFVQIAEEAFRRDKVIFSS